MAENSFILTQVMQRYAIDPLKADGYFFYTNPPLPDVNKEFLFSLISSFEERTFSAAEFDQFSIEMIVDYIQRTHSFYLQKKLPEIEQSIILLSGLYESNHPILSALRNFFRRYCQEL